MADDNPIVEYRPLPGFPDYFVGDDGSVWSEKRGRRRRLKFHVRRDGYLYTKFKDADGMFRTVKLHRAVLLAFRGPCPSGMVSRHLDGNKLNCRLENLVWGTSQENSDDMKLHGVTHVGENHYASILTRRDVLIARRLRRTTAMTYLQIAKRVKPDAHLSTLVHAITGKTWKHIAGATHKGE